MTGTPESFDIVVIGSGPAGQKAAIQGAKAGRRVLLVERERNVGGACVHSGTIPSKSLRETASALSTFAARTNRVARVELPEHVQLQSLMSRLECVTKAHAGFIGDQLQRNGITEWHGRAAFRDSHEVEVTMVRGEKRLARGELVVIATGSRPRSPDDIPVDHEHILDSDSILSLSYLPESLTVLGSGVIASEYATIFAALGVRVTMIDRYAAPLGFLDPELTERFVAHFQDAMPGRFVGETRVESVRWNGVDAVETRLDNGEVVRSDKMLCAQGRVANVGGLAIENAGLAVNKRGLIDVNQHLQTAVPHIYAVGDVVGPPALASTSMEQGRRAILHAIGEPVTTPFSWIPIGIYTIPEMASVGLTEPQAREQHGTALVGRAPYSELARGQLACCTDGMLKLVCDPEGRRVLGVHIFGEGSTELIHLGQMALLTGAPLDMFVESTFNFPTLAEAYRVAALAVCAQRVSCTSATVSPG